MKFDNIYYLEYFDYCFHLYCYIHNVLADTFFGLLRVFLVKLGSLQSNPVDKMKGLVQSST